MESYFREESNDRDPLILISFLFLVILYCCKDYTESSVLVYTIKCVACVHTDKGSFLAFRLIDVTSRFLADCTICCSECRCQSLERTNIRTDSVFW